MKENYDVIVVGAGPAGIMTCYELYLKNPELEVLLIDKGHDVMNRHCPIKDKKLNIVQFIKIVNLDVSQLVLLQMVLVERVLTLMVNLILQVNSVVG